MHVMQQNLSVKLSAERHGLDNTQNGMQESKRHVDKESVATIVRERVRKQQLLVP